MLKILSIIKNNFYVLLLILVAGFICYKNYVPNTFLTGWDTLHPEFNYSEYWKRIFNGAWQEHQGLGAVNTQAHSSEIPHVLILMFLDLFFKLSDLRYLYAFLMLILGPLGVYFYVKKVFLMDLPKFSSFGAFSAGLFYLLNLGTLQHFYVPLEMFLTQYAFLGWVFLYSTLFFETKSRRSYALFVLFSFFMIPQAHTPTLFYTFFLAFLLYFFILAVVETAKNRGLLSNFKKFFIIINTVLLLNSFWMFPSFYFLFTSSSLIQESKIHHLFSDEAFLANVKFGTISDIAILRGFLFDWGEYVGNNEFSQLLNEWLSYYESTNYLYIGYIFFILILIGILFSIFMKHKYWLPVVVGMFVSIIFLFSINPPFGFIMELLITKVPLVKEILRFPFTKFSILLIFYYALFFGTSLAFINKFFVHIFAKSRVKPSYISLSMLLSLLLSFYLYMRPAFEGNLISNSMKVSIPNRYFELFEYLNNQEDYGRVAHLPVHSFWGWVYYSWNDITKLGYQGAGFLWFGIDKPLIDREFDRWNIANEQVYRELSHAIYSKDLILLENTLKKYKILWLLMDESIIAPGYKNTVLFRDEIPSMLGNSTKFKLEKDFGSGLYLYRYISETPYALYEHSVPYKILGNPYFREPLDYYYKNFGNYIYGDIKQFPFIYNLGTNEEILDKSIYSDATTIYLGFNKALRPISNVFSILLPDLQNSYADSLVEIDGEFYPIADLNNIDLKTNSNRLNIYKEDVLVTMDIYPTLESCSVALPNASYSVERLSSGFTLKARNIRACVTSQLGAFDFLYQKASNVFVIQGDNLYNRDVCIYDKEQELCKNFSLNGKIYAYLDKPIDSYTLRITSNSFVTPFEKVNTFSNLKAGWLVLEESINLQSIERNIPMNNLSLTKDKRFSSSVVELPNDPRLCEFSSGDLGDSLVNYTSDSIIYKSKAQSVCDSFYFHTLDQSKGYILEVKSRNIEGVPLRFCLTNEQTKRCDAYFSLPANKELKSNYYILPPFSDGVGYTVNVSNNNFGDFPATNELSYISFTPINYDLIKGLHTGDISNLETKNNIFVYNEAFDKGWLAICGGELCDAEHVVFNNWANAWVFKGKVPENITIIFWPQYLQYFGYLLLLVPFYIVFRLPASHKEPKHHKNPSHSD